MTSFFGVIVGGNQQNKTTTQSVC